MHDGTFTNNFWNRPKYGKIYVKIRFLREENWMSHEFRYKYHRYFNVRYACSVILIYHRHTPNDIATPFVRSAGHEWSRRSRIAIVCDKKKYRIYKKFISTMNYFVISSGSFVIIESFLKSKCLKLHAFK